MHDIPKIFKNKSRRYVWEYRSINNELLGYVARYDACGKKEVVPYFYHVNDRSLKSGCPTEGRPLFGLELLGKADSTVSIFVVEGEKSAASLQSLGFVAVTSLGGSQASHKTDWTPLEGHERVYLLPDNDEPGQAYVKATAAILAGLINPPLVFIVRLPGLPPSGDIVDWITTRINHAFMEWDGFRPVPESGIDVKALLHELHKEMEIYSEAVPEEWLTEGETITGWQAPISLEATTLPAWPDDAFPGSIQVFVTALSASTETPPELPAMMVLSAMSAAAQGKYRVQVKADYFEPVNIWACAALPSGNRKTAVQMATTAPLIAWEKRQREAVEPDIKQAESNHATLLARISQLRKEAGKAAEADFDKLKEKIAELEAALPEIPTLPQVWAQDVTPENLGTIMAANNERMAVLSDESGIFDILAGRYSGEFQISICFFRVMREAPLGSTVVAGRLSSCKRPL